MVAGVDDRFAGWDVFSPHDLYFTKVESGHYLHIMLKKKIKELFHSTAVGMGAKI